MYTKTELTLIRHVFDHTFVADGKPAANTLGMDEAFPAIQRLTSITIEYNLNREEDRQHMIKELRLTDPKTALFDMVQMHRYVLDGLYELIDRV